MQTKYFQFSLLVVSMALFGTSCFRQAYFLSPFGSPQNTYHAMPMLNDQKKASSYISLTGNFSTMNDNGTDDVYFGQLKWHRAGKIANNVEGYLGTQFSAGSYKISAASFFSEYYFYPYPVPSQSFDTIATRRIYTASAGLTGGLAYVIPIGNRHEWRIAGIESALSRELGDYLRFRKEIPDSLGATVDVRNYPACVGGFTELIFKPSNEKIRFGFRTGFGTGIFPVAHKGYDQSVIRPRYFYETFHFTYDHYTNFLTINLSNHQSGVQLGFSYRF